MKRILVLASICLCLLAFSCKTEEKNEQIKQAKVEDKAQVKSANALNKYKLKILRVIDRPGDSYTQGLVYNDGFLYESGGLRGRSALHKIDAGTGKVIKTQNVSKEYFAEGLDLFKNKLYQITWQEKTCFVYDIKSFKQEKTFSYFGEGWGLTNDGENLIMSDGSNILKVIDPATFTLLKTIMVLSPSAQNVNMLNELEYVDGKVYANIWQTDEIAIIDYKTGKQTGVIDLSQLRSIMANDPDAEVTNGIAYNSKTKTFFLTGKLWNKIFEVELIEDNS